MSLFARLFSRAEPTLSAASPRDAGSLAALHAASFSRGWGETEFEQLLTDRSVVADRAISGRRNIGFIISRRLQNTGSRPLVTDHYGHNFTIIDDEPIGPDYRVLFPFVVTAKQSMNSLAETSGKQIVFRKALQRGDK